MSMELTPAQTELLVEIAGFLDGIAGEGIGFTPEDTGRTAWADDLVLRLMEAFGIDCSEEDLAEALRRSLAHVTQPA